MKLMKSYILTGNKHKNIEKSKIFDSIRYNRV